MGEVIMGLLSDFCPSLLTTKSKRSLQFSRSFRASLRLSRESMKDPLILVTTSPSFKSPSLSASIAFFWRLNGSSILGKERQN